MAVECHNLSGLRLVCVPHVYVVMQQSTEALLCKTCQADHQTLSEMNFP